MAEDRGGPEVVPADPAYRRRALWTLLAATVAGMLLVLVTEWRLDALGAELDELPPEAALDRIGSWLTGVAVSMAVMSGGGAVFFLRTARRILRSGRYPPPGTRVARDTVIRRGRAAKRRAYLLLAVAAAFAVGAVAAPLVLRSAFRAAAAAVTGG